MKTKLLIVLLVTFASSNLLLAKSGTCGENITWDLDKNGVLTITGTGAMYDYYSSSDVPWSYAGYYGVKSLSMSEGITYIGTGAFISCLGLTSVTIPNSVQSIGSSAFYNCYNLTSVTLGNHVETIGGYAFYNCNGLKSIDIPQSVITIEINAFRACHSLETVSLSNSVTSIEFSAFAECHSLISPVYNTRIFAALPISYTGAYIVPDGIETIIGGAFAECGNLSSINIPNSVTSIGNYAFDNCSGLTAIELPHNLSEISEGTFRDCSSLTSVTIPKSVLNIGVHAFQNCSLLTSIFVPCGELERFQKMLSGDKRVKYEPLPFTISISPSKYGKVTIPSSICDDQVVTAVPNYGYHFTQWSDGNMDNPRTIILTQDTTFAAEYAVDKSGTCGDKSLLQWEYDDQSKILTISGEGALNSNYTFGVEAPTSVEKVVFEEGVTSIGNSAFANYSTIQEISISSSVKKIYEQAFYNCENLQNIYNYRAQPAVVYSNTFDGIDKFGCKLYVPTASIDMYKAATGWRDFFYIEALVIKYKVTFLDWDETILSTQEVVSGEAAIAPADPTRTGYTFTGWDKDFSNVAEEMVVTAQYQINQYKVDFVDWDGMLLKTENVTYNTAATPPADPSREWYTFVGWDKEYCAVTADLVVTAQYEEGQVVDYNITFTNSRDNSEISIVPIQIEVPAPPVIAGFTFVNWEIVSGDIRDGFKVQAVYTADVPASAPEVYTNPTNPAQKLIRNGNVYILHGDKTYTITGQEVK